MGLSSKLISGDRVQTQFGVGTFEPPKNHQKKLQPPSQQQQTQSEPLECPRCHSTNTKFCYYNNYTKSQPRHFCRSCKRHWTLGGTLRNVPVGGVRKNKRRKTTTATSKAATTATATTEDTSSLPQDFSYINGAFEGLFQFPLQIPYPSHTSFESDPSSCYYRGDLESEPMESFTMASDGAAAIEPWRAGGTRSFAVDASSWGLDDIDALVSVDLGLTWDDDDSDPITPWIDLN